MKASFAARRKPKIIAREQDEEEVDNAQSEPTIVSSVKRPSIRPKNPSSRQISFSAGASRNPSSSASQNVSDEDSETFVVKKSSLSQQAIARNAARKAALNLSDARLTAREDEDRPSYSREALAQLRDSTPVTPAAVDSADDVELLRAIDVAAKFGTDYNVSGAIPTDAEIAEKKARRARLAKEIKYAGSGSDDDEQEMPDMGRDSDDDEFRMQVDRVRLTDVRPPKYAETRLVRDDEDVMEGFDEFIPESGRIEIGRKAEKKAQKMAREEMRVMINEAEGSESDDSDDSERERREMYEVNQTKKAMGSAQTNAQRNDTVSTRFPPIPTMGGVLDKLRRALEETTLMKQAKQREIDEIEQERREIAEREGDVQRALKETAEQYQKISLEAGIKLDAPVNGFGVQDALALRDETADSNEQRGLESLGNNS